VKNHTNDKEKGSYISDTDKENINNKIKECVEFLERADENVSEE